VLFTGSVAYNVFHAYSAADPTSSNYGRPMLRVSELVWDAEGWPISGGP
jgi:arabinan endo-1,5-alpha-L-arabinosidase